MNFCVEHSWPARLFRSWSLLERSDECQDVLNLRRSECSGFLDWFHFVAGLAAAVSHALTDKIIALLLCLLGAKMHNGGFHQLIHLGTACPIRGVALLAEFCIQLFSRRHIPFGCSLGLRISQH